MVNKKVFGLQISVNEAVAMQKMQTRACLDEVIKRLCFAHVPFVSDNVEQITFLSIFKKQVKITT